MVTELVRYSRPSVDRTAAGIVSFPARRARMVSVCFFMVVMMPAPPAPAEKLI